MLELTVTAHVQVADQVIFLCRAAFHRRSAAFLSGDF
jgi:hypothetical protein